MKKKGFWTHGPGSFLIAIGCALMIRWLFLESYVIPTSSMIPTLLVNDHIFVNKISFGLRIPFTEKWLVNWGEPQRGDVVIFKFPESRSKYFIKRVIGVPGDRIYYENGQLYVNEAVVEKSIPKLRKADEQWLTDEQKEHFVQWEESLNDHNYSILLKKGERDGESFGPITVPAEHYFVMGDSRDNSEDSRMWEPERRFVPQHYIVGRAAFVWLSCEKTFSFLPILCNPLSVRFSRIFQNIQ